MIEEQTFAVRHEEPAWLSLGHQQLGRERLPGSDQLWPYGIFRVLRYLIRLL
jgi:hypothetical protein